MFESGLGIQRGASVYLTEELTPFARALAIRGWAARTSEFLTGIPGGSVDARGVRCEDLTQLSFGDGSFDALLCFDVLEHIPDYAAALREMRRVVRPGGCAMLTFPFVRTYEATHVRAKPLPDGSIHHFDTPEYHGNPTDPARGVLCYYHFGWDILDAMRDAGFEKSEARWYWSSDYGYIGPEQVVFVGC